MMSLETKFPLFLNCVILKRKLAMQKLSRFAVSDVFNNTISG